MICTAPFEMAYQSPFGFRNIVALSRCRDVEVYLEWEFNRCEGTKEHKSRRSCPASIKLVAIILRPQDLIAVTGRSNSPAAEAGKTGLTLPCESYAPHKSPVIFYPEIPSTSSTHKTKTTTKTNHTEPKSDLQVLEYFSDIQTKTK